MAINATMAVLTAESSRKPKTALTSNPAIVSHGRGEGAADKLFAHVSSM